MNNAKPTARLTTPTDLGANAQKDITGALNALLADTFALYMKTKNFHWHASGPHFRDYHLLFDEHADQIFATTDVLAERVRKLGGLHCDRSAISRAINASPIMTQSMSIRRTCWPSYAKTISA